MGIRHIFTPFILTFAITSILALDVEINCTYKSDQSVWTPISTQFITCELETDLKPSDTIKGAIGNTGTITNAEVKVFVSEGKKVMQIPDGLKNVFTGLEGIKLDGTEFLFLDGEQLKNVTGLKYLAVTNGAISVVYAETFKGLADLILIDLTGNPIMYIGLAAFDGTTALNNLILLDAICIPGETKSATGRTEIDNLVGSFTGNCDYGSFLETILSKTTKKFLDELSKECESGNEEECPADCTEELKEINLRLNATIDELEGCKNETVDLNADILELEQKVEELEALTSNTGNGTCGFKTVSNFYSCYAKISVKTAADQTVNWTGTHPEGKNDDAVVSMVIFSQTVEILPLNIGTAFKNLKSLTVKNSGLKKIAAGDFKTLTKLETLEITGNNIATIDATAFSGLTALKKIDLSANKLTVLPSKVFETLSALSIINLSDNNLKVRYDVISSTNTITEVYFKNNNAIVPLDRTLIWRLQKARKIDLSGTNCTFSLDKDADPNQTFMSFYSDVVLNC